jgi:hypothetical protein
MSLQMLVRLSRAALVAGAVAAVPLSASAQQQPSAGAMSAASEIVDVRGAMAVFEPLIPGVVEQAKNVFLQTNPMLQKDLNEAAANVRKTMSARTTELKSEVAKIYASRFTEQELKDLLAFYKSPLGKKMLAEETIVIENTLRMAQDWANRLSEEVIAQIRAEMKKKGHNL